jgi:hypothetical protein
MKNRRLNVLFIAIIALAAAPQALQDAHSLVNAAQERAETEFWSVFLSYQTPGPAITEKSAATELVAARQPETKESCPVEQMAGRALKVVRDAEANDNAARVKIVNVEAMRASAKANKSVPETIEVNFADGESVASLYTVRAVAFSEKEQKGLNAACLHARDTERIADAASKAALASFIQGKENTQIKVKQLMEMDKLLRQRTRSMMDRGESVGEMPNPNPVGSM